MNPIIELYQAFMEIVVFTMTPISIVLTPLCWFIALKYPFKFPSVIALLVTLSAASLAVLASVAYARVRLIEVSPELAEFLAIGSSTAVAILAVLPATGATYLVYMHFRTDSESISAGRSTRNGYSETPPPETTQSSEGIPIQVDDATPSAQTGVDEPDRDAGLRTH